MRSEVQIFPDPPHFSGGAIAQMGERLLCTQEVGGSIPPGSTICGSQVSCLESVSVTIKLIMFIKRQREMRDAEHDQDL